MAEKAAIYAKTSEPKQKCSSLCKQESRVNNSGSPADRILHLQRTAGNQAVQRLIRSGVLQAKLKIGQPNDMYEQEADRVAEKVMQMPEPQVQRKCANCDENEKKLQLKESSGKVPVNSGQDVPSIVHDVLRSPGRPLDTQTRAFMEPRFGHDFGSVRVHTDLHAEQSADAVSGQAYTVGSHVVFGAGRYCPATPNGRRLLAHELTHVVQQNASPLSSGIVQRVPLVTGAEGDVVAEREYGSSGAPKAQNCGRPSWCPAGFCEPYRSEKLAEYYRSKKAWWIMKGISAAVDSRVVPLWSEYLWGGSSPKNLSADFGKDFTNSPTTKETTTFLYDEIKKSLTAKPPSVPPYSNDYIDLNTLIPKAISELDDPASLKQMNFNIPKDIPGNLAGGIGKNQLSCPAGAKPSPFNDERHAGGMVKLTRLASSDLIVTPYINYSVKDTIDLCPGDCGTILEQIATVPLSQFEATGISGDVPFTVEFPAPSMGSFTIYVPLSKIPGPVPSPKKP